MNAAVNTIAGRARTGVGKQVADVDAERTCGEGERIDVTVPTGAVNAMASAAAGRRDGGTPMSTSVFVWVERAGVWAAGKRVCGSAGG